MPTLLSKYRQYIAAEEVFRSLKIISLQRFERLKKVKESLDKMERLDKEERECQAVSEFCEAILREAVFECSREVMQKIQAAEAKEAAWKMELKRVEMEEEKKPEKDEDISTRQTRELTITKVHEQRIAENPLKNVVGHVNKDPVQNSEHNGSIYDKEREKVEKKKKRDIIKEEKIREKKAKEEEKIVQRQYKAIDKSIKKYTKDVKSKWKKEEKRRKQMKKMEKKAQRMLEKEMKKIEKESAKDEKKKHVQAIDVVQEKQNVFKTVETKEETEKIEDEKQNDLKKSETKKETEITQENEISCDVIEKNERKENDKKDAKDTNNAGKKNTFAASFVAFFHSCSCIKGQRESQAVC